MRCGGRYQKNYSSPVPENLSQQWGLTKRHEIVIFARREHYELNRVLLIICARNSLEVAGFRNSCCSPSLSPNRTALTYPQKTTLCAYCGN